MSMPGGYQQPGYQQSGLTPPPAYAAQEPPVARVGGVIATPTQIITPIGAWPAGDVQITVRDETVMVSKIPTWAVVLSIVGFFILTIFSLLFLLVKENVPAGGVRVIVTARNGQTYTELIPVPNPAARHNVMQQIGMMQQVSDRERWRLSGSN